MRSERKEVETTTSGEFAPPLIRPLANDQCLDIYHFQVANSTAGNRISVSIRKDILSDRGVQPICAEMP